MLILTDQEQKPVKVKSVVGYVIEGIYEYKL